MRAIRLTPGAISLERLRSLSEDGSDASLEAEELEDGSLLLTLGSDGDATARLIAAMALNRQTRAKEAIFDAIEQQFGKEVASALCASTPHAAMFHAPTPLRVGDVLDLIAAAQELATRRPTEAPAADGAKAGEHRRRLRLL
ncbi:MAG: hypothetical protein AAF713_02735 [Pseudomonadota bacterium]